jgi:serine/threonine protein kinase
MKQIANGFRELHKWNIMHRDVKPANIFFKGDTVKIGDFGFAKWGDEYTRTKLGTPMTMAPELQDVSTIYYSDKVDLWSIGVVFYMMLFGNKGPWEFRTAMDLKTKINTESGNKLKFGKNPISNAAKDLLIRLIEPNPKKRISWDDFFNHKLFVDHSANIGMIDPGRSVFLHDKSAIVEDLWNKNRGQKHEEGQMREPENIPIKKIEEHYGKHTAPPQSDRELKFNLELVKKRFSHEKEKTISMCKGSVYCRDASKLTKSEVGIKLVLASLGMAQSTILITEKMISQIENKTNEWHLKDWAEWIKGASPKILVSYLKADLTHYKLLACHFKDKMPEGYGSNS